MTDSFDPTDDLAFRRVLGHFASGIVVVTGVDDERRVGFTCQSFASVSLQPPLVAFFVGSDSTSGSVIRSTGAFCVNVLGADQELLSRIFAVPGADKFRDVSTRPAPSGAPILDGVIAWLDCRIRQEFDAGDHVGVIGEVTALHHGTAGRPLLYYRGGYGDFA